MKTFEPILNDKPLSFAYDHKDFFRNKAREDKWGTPVYFAPSTNKYDVVGTAGPYYVYGKPCKKGQGKKGNCTWWVISRYHMVSGIILKECLGDAQDFLKKYVGRKDNVGYIGGTIQKGDILVFKDSDYGHVVFVEDVDFPNAYISESAYSSKSIYEDKACITYTLNLSDMICGNKVKLRPQMPFTETLVGVIHTGDVFDREDKKSALEKENKALKERLAKIKELCD